MKELKTATLPFSNITYTFPGQNYVFMIYFSDFSYAVLGQGIPVLFALADYLETRNLKVKYQFPKCLRILEHYQQQLFKP